MDKFIIQTYQSNVMTGNIVRLTDEAAQTIRQIQRECGISARRLVSEMIRFAAERLEIREVP